MTGASPTYKPPMLDRSRAFRRVLGFVPTAILVFWFCGIAEYRGWDLDGSDRLLLFLVALSLRYAAFRVIRPRPTFVLRPNETVSLTATVAGVVAAVGMVFGGLVEASVPENDPALAVPWILRTLWHGGCAFGTSYCGFLFRHLPQPARPQPA